MSVFKGRLIYTCIDSFQNASCTIEKFDIHHVKFILRLRFSSTDDSRDTYVGKSCSRAVLCIYCASGPWFRSIKNKNYSSWVVLPDWNSENYRLKYFTSWTLFSWSTLPLYCQLPLWGMVLKGIKLRKTRCQIMKKYKVTGHEECRISGLVACQFGFGVKTRRLI